MKRLRPPTLTPSVRYERLPFWKIALFFVFMASWDVGVRMWDYSEHEAQRQEWVEQRIDDTEQRKLDRQYMRAYRQQAAKYNEALHDLKLLGVLKRMAEDAEEISALRVKKARNGN